MITKSKLKHQTVIFFTGASGGHILPAKVLQKHRPGSYIIAIKNSVSLSILKDTNNVIYLPPLSLRKLGFSALADLLKFIIFIISLKPGKIVCFGSYLNLAGVVCSALTGAEILFFEPNLVPGKGTLLLRKFPGKIFTIFSRTRKFLGQNTTVVKMPVFTLTAGKERILESLKFDFQKPVLLVLGGSQGSHFINTIICEILEKLDFAQIIHITGDRDFDFVLKRYSSHRGKHIVLPFTSTMPLFYNIAAAAVSRAGAGTLAELSYYGIPSLLIPYPQAGGHQEFNALHFKNSGGSTVLNQQNAAATEVLSALERIIFTDFWKMKENLAKITIADDGTDLAGKILSEP